jgi:hypothetical protein
VTADLAGVDPFDLPEWLGVSDVTWSAGSGVRSGHAVEGRLSAGDHELACDLIAVDDAFPTPVAGDATRVRAHQAWRNGEVHLVTRHERLTLAVPGSGFTADLVLDALSRLAKAVGASPDHYTARLRIGAERRR